VSSVHTAMNSFSFPGIVGLAPMAGITDFCFRKICFDWGADFAYTEMISAESIVRNIAVEHLLPSKVESNVAIQIFGSDPCKIADAAALVELKGSWININAACPVRKVVSKGAGGALLRDLKKLRQVVRCTKSAVKKPLTVKVRLGWDRDEVDRIIQICLEEGADGLEIHTRTVKQLYGGRAGSFQMESTNSFEWRCFHGSGLSHLCDAWGERCSCCKGSPQKTMDLSRNQGISVNRAVTDRKSFFDSHLSEEGCERR